MDRLQAYINVEATGIGGAAMLFETGPGERLDRQAVGAVGAASARRVVRGRDLSPAAERHRLLDPQAARHARAELRGDRRQLRVPHGARHAGSADGRALLQHRRERRRARRSRSTRWTCRRASAADARRSSTSAQVVAVSWGPMTSWFIAALALGCGLLAWFKTLGASVRLVGLGRWILDAVWALVGVAAVAAAMVGGTWALRAARAGLPPVVRASRPAVPDAARARHARGLGRGPRSARCCRRARTAPRHPVLVWSLTLPLWIAARRRHGGGCARRPGTCGRCRCSSPASGCSPCRSTNVAGGPRHLRRGARGGRHAVAARHAGAAALRRRAARPPADHHAGVGLRGADARVRRDGRAAVHRRGGGDAGRCCARRSCTALLLVAVVVTGGLAYAAPAYTYDAAAAPLALRVFAEPDASDGDLSRSASQEPGLDLDPARRAAGTGRPTRRRPASRRPLRSSVRLPHDRRRRPAPRRRRSANSR